ncbi:DNA segregation ATPase FtsK/SpoIIIE [Candidatus Liberibacter americanus str. Sao Paulo]|uniref:DNA translocase FtsK n=1 Tax=Candidatus Liberibacter americanus str. Sao Paulo TaxID=1261131 RepID=U6B6N4_9HYPH|nr:DNA segregation ATPase FtsK/SpoIIIE [Candidatus Liberibacter americanus str. Sao Paulo]EMS36508.1 DNA translocase FtsK [Candidatus Liberibacter americanus PW_SP]
MLSVILALATWDVYDPSLSYITINLPNNLLGYGGAIFADIVMQCFGIAIVFCLPPPIAWSIALILGNNINLFSKRFIAWIANFLISSSFFASFIPSRFWPIQNGFGGIIGDAILRLPILFVETYPIRFFFLKMILFCLMIFLLLFASNAIVIVQDDVQDKDEKETLLEDKRMSILGFIWNIMRLLMVSISRIFELFYFPFFTRRDEYENSNILNKYRKVEPSLDKSFSNVIDSGRILTSRKDNLFNTDIFPSIGNTKNVDNNIDMSYQSSVRYDSFSLPVSKILSNSKSSLQSANLSPDIMRENAYRLTGVLSDFGIHGEIVNVRPGPVVTLYELEPAPGIKSSRIIGLSDDIARSMSAVSARVAVIPGRNAIGIELPNDVRDSVVLKDLIVSNAFANNKSDLAINLGKNIEGEPVVADLAKMPHLLIAGTTGSGKSVAINTMILSLLYRMSPDKCRLLMIDPKMLELSIYDGIPNLLTPVVTDSKKAVFALKWLVCEMEERYRKMSKIGVRNIDGFNMKVAHSHVSGDGLNRTVQTGFDPKTGEAIYETEHFELQHMPYIVVVIDEMADLMMVARKDIEGAVQRLAQMARAAGIHVIMATQRPSVDVITGTIKANFPTRISFQVSSKIDSRTILGEQGAEQLLGKGDMLYMTGGGRIQRIHGPFVSDREVEDVVSHLKMQGKPQYIDLNDKIMSGEGVDILSKFSSSESDDLYQQAVAIVLRDNKASISYIQRRLGIGYNRAASIIEDMEEKGVIGAANSSGKREILVSSMEEFIE